METNHEKLTRLLKANKLQIDRNKIIERYQVEFGYPLNENIFYDVERSKEIRRKVYNKKTSPTEYKEFQDYNDIINELKRIKEELEGDLGKSIFFQYFITLDGLGGVRITLEESWSIIQKITKPSLDIIVADEDFIFGFCIEADEHSYFIFNWSL
jgi:hypothetical protein